MKTGLSIDELGIMEMATPLDCNCFKPSSLATSRSILVRQDTANDTDCSISTASMDGQNNGVSKDLVTADMVSRKAFRWCQDSIGGAWGKVRSENELIITHISGGMSNYLYLISLPKHIKPLKDEPSEVLLRIYGQICKSTLDFLVHNSVVFALLAERNLGPKPFGMYHDGRIEEYIKARSLSPEDLKRSDVMDMVAEKLAQFHALNMPLCKKPRWFKSLVRGWIRDIQNQFEVNSGVLKALTKMSPNFSMEAEFSELLNVATRLNCPVVFCHNDLQGGNLLLADESEDPANGRMTIIDWEYGHYNYRGYDMGNHFNEWMYDYSSSGRPGYKWIPENYPGRKQQYQFFQSYLLAAGQTDITEATLEDMYRETITLSLHSHFLWGVWSIVQAQTSSIDFDYIGYALCRFEAYFLHKKNLPAILANKKSGS